MPNNEAEIEAAIQAKGLNAPRLTPEMIDGKIMEARYQWFPGTTLILCVLTLANGFTVTGESVAASPGDLHGKRGPFSRQTGPLANVASQRDHRRPHTGLVNPRFGIARRRRRTPT